MKDYVSTYDKDGIAYKIERVGDKVTLQYAQVPDGWVPKEDLDKVEWVHVTLPNTLKELLVGLHEQKKEIMCFVDAIVNRHPGYWEGTGVDMPETPEQAMRDILQDAYLLGTEVERQGEEEEVGEFEEEFEEGEEIEEEDDEDDELADLNSDVNNLYARISSLEAEVRSMRRGGRK